jgi:hypothetical protein
MKDELKQYWLSFILHPSSRIVFLCAPSLRLCGVSVLFLSGETRLGASAVQGL